MKIKQILLEGFKSYAKKTMLKKLDSQFNGITGLNGSGKSNILEAICFLLGLQTLSLARVTKMRELIYKNGQAGIKHALVTIVFCNKDKETSPYGYENVDEIVISRIIKQNKTYYLLNGKHETNTKIKSIFKSIGLNIDNYSTFFVKQGKITSIVNFKPRDLMSFLEETAGVNYYNAIRNKTLKTLDDKKETIKNYSEIMDNDIQQKYQRIDTELENYKKFKNIESDLDHLTRKLQFCKEKHGQGNLVKLEKEISELTKSISSLNKNVKRNNNKINEIMMKIQTIDNSCPKNTDLSELINKETLLKDDISKMENELKILKQKKMRKIEIFEKYNLNKREAEKEKVKKTIKKKNLLKKIGVAENNLSKVELELKELDVQKGSNKSENFFNQKYEETKKSLNDLKEKQESIFKNIKSHKNKKINLKTQLEELKENHESYKKKLKSLKSEKTALETDLSEKERKFVNLRKFQNNLEIIKNKIDDGYKRKNQHLGRAKCLFEINYNKNVRNTVRDKIYGKVHSLMQVKDPEKFNLALETIAKNKLFFIIVSDDNVAKEILEKNIIEGKKFLIPNSKIQGRIIDQNKYTKCIDIAKKCNGYVWRPLSTFNYKENLNRSFSYIFSSNLICSSEEIATKIAFNKELRIRCITLAGDIYDPMGSLEGGYNNRNFSNLAKSSELKQIVNAINSLKKERDQISETIQNIKMVSENCKNMKIRKENLEKEIRNLENSLRDLNVENINLKIEEIDEKIINFEDELEFYKKKIINLQINKKELEKNLKKNKRKSLANNYFEKRFEDLTKEKKDLNREMNENKKEAKEIEFFLDSTDKDNENLETNKIKLNKEIEKINKEMINFKRDLNKNQEDLNDLENKIDENKSKNEQINKKKNRLEEEKLELEGDNKKLNEEITQKKTDLENRRINIDQLEVNFININKKKRISTNSQEFDVKEENLIEEITKLKNQISELQKEKTYFSKRINIEIEEESEKFKKQYKIVKNQKQEILKNQSILHNSITKLDHKKHNTILHCFHKVNESLGKLFQALLPGAFAKMELNDYDDKRSKTKFKGVEIKISFNGKWKDSLSELSGGQRSLLALSFLLALLSYNPAPFYIFDEVDAALDLSHTENLGVLIAKHFPQSQFIVISLKEGFYNNSNVLFKTSQINGSSKIERIDLKKKRTQNNLRLDFE